MITLCPDTAEQRLLSEASRIAWESTRVAEIEKDTERKGTANTLAMESAKCTNSLFAHGRDDIALETGITTLYLFQLGEHYGQIVSSARALRDKVRKSRFEEDLDYYLETAQSAISHPNMSKRSGRLNALYTLIWEKGILGTTEATEEMGKKYDREISNPTANTYSRILHLERRAYRLGGPTGYKIEMFFNQKVSLSREANYGKMAFFEGRLVERGPGAFERLWGEDRRHRKVFEIENGNDPRTFAIMTVPPKERRQRRTTEAEAGNGYGVLGELHPLSEMPKYGFRPRQSIQMADFLANCTVRSERGGLSIESG